MKNYYLRLKDVDFTYTNGQWVSGIVDLYDNEAIASMATPSYVNYSTTRSAYGTNLLGNDIWTGLNILDDSASPNIVTDSGYVKDGRFVDTTGRINVTTWDISYNNFSANDVTALISFYYTDLSTLNFPDEWPSIDSVPLNRGIYLPNTPRYGRIVLDLTSEKDLSSISFDLYVKVLIDKPVITPLYDRTTSILRKFPEWMEIRRDSEPSATPSLATPTTLAGSFINAVAGEWLDDLINDVGYLQLQSFIETSDVGQLDWVYITSGIPDKIVQVIGDGTILSRAFDTIEFSKSKEDDDLFYLDQSTNTIYVRKYYQILTIDDTRFNQSLSQVWNWFDEHGLSVDLERHTGETNDSFKKRILDVYKNKPGVGLEAFKLALRRELNLWLYEGATPDSAFLGATPEVLEMSDILSDPLHVTPDGLPTDKLISLIDYMAVTYPTTWGYFKWDQAYWDIDGEGSKGYGVLPYRYDPEPLADSDTQSGVGDDMDLFLYRPDAITGPREFDLSVTARGFTKTLVDDYLPIQMSVDVFGRAEKTVYVVPEEDFWLNFKATMEDGKVYRSSIYVDRSGATPNTNPSYFDFTTSIPVVDTNRLQPYLNWYDIEEQKYTGTAITSMKAKLADITGSYVFQMPRDSIYGSINPDIQEGKSVTLYSGESYIFGTIEEISQSSDLYVDDINLFDYIKISDIVYNGDLTSSRWTIPNYLNLLTGDATPVFSLDTLEAGFGLYDFSPSSAIQSTEYQYFLYDHASPVSDKYYAVFGFESGSINSATPTILDDNELIFHRSNSEIKGNVYYTDTDPDDSTFVGITSPNSINATAITIGGSYTISLSPNNNLYSIGDKIRVARTAGLTSYFEGVITAKGSTVFTTVTVTAKSFTGSFSGWTITPIWDDPIVVAAKALAVADGYDEYIILEMSSVSGDWTPYDGWEIWPSGFHGVDSYPSGDLSLYVSDKLNHSTPSDYIDADSATPGTYLDTDLRAFQEFVVGVNGSTTLTDYKWVSDSQTFLVSVNSGVAVSSTSSWSADIPEIVWDQYITSEESKEIVVELLTVNDDGDYGAMVPYDAASYGSGAVPEITSNIFIPKENIYVNGSNSWVNIDTGGGERYAVILPATETSIEITVDNIPGNYVALPGTSGNYVSTPDSAALSITGDIDVRVKLNASPLGTRIIASKWGGGAARSWNFYMTSTNLWFDLSTDGSQVASSSTRGFGSAIQAGTDVWVRVTLDVDNGSTQHVVTFYTSSDGINWSALSPVTNAGIVAVFDSATPVELGTSGAGVTAPFVGTVYRAIVKNGIAGTTVADFDATKFQTAASTTCVAVTGETWTLNKSGASPATVFLSEYPLHKIKYIPFESTIANIASGVVDENGPWRNGNKPSSGLNNYGFTTLEVDRNDFGIANSEDSIVTWIGVSTNNDRVISWLDQNTVEPSFNTAWASGTSYPLDSITEIDNGSGLFYYSPFVVRVKMKSEINPQWNPQMHSGWFYDRNDEYYFYVDPIEEVASPGSEGATFSDFYTEKVPRQGAPILVKALSSTPVEMRQVSFFDENINLSLKNTQYVYGTGTEKLYLAYENIYDATVSDYTSGQLIVSNGYSSSNEIDVNQETLTNHVYEVSYKLRDSFIVDNEYFTANGAQRAKITFDSTPSGATPFSVVYESSVFDPATPIDVPLNPFYTTVEEGFVFISLNEYEASTPITRVSPGILVANGTDYAIVSIYSVDSFGNPKPNQSYNVSTTFGTFDSTGTNTAPITTDRDGFAWLTLTSEEGSDVEVATVTVAGDFTSELNLEIEARKFEPYKLHALADPTAIPADGLSATSVYGKVLNEDGNPVPYAYVSYKKGRSVYEIFTNNNSTPDVGPDSSPAATPIWPDSGRVTADSSGVFRIGPFVSATPNMPGYWFVSTESYSSSPSGGETWEAVGDVVFWREYPPKFRSVNGENQSIPTSQNLNIQPKIYLDESGRLVIEPLIPPPATVNAFPVTFDEETPTADATPVTNTWSPAKWYAINLYDQYQRGMLGDDFYVFKIENLPQIHPDYRDV